MRKAVGCGLGCYHTIVVFSASLLPDGCNRRLVLEKNYGLIALSKC